MSKLSTVLAREETMERQRSRITWLREGDRNTEFFQAKAKARGRSNRIKLLTTEDGRVLTEQEDLERMACDFYQRLRMSSVLNWYVVMCLEKLHPI